MSNDLPLSSKDQNQGSDTNLEVDTALWLERLNDAINLFDTGIELVTGQYSAKIVLSVWQKRLDYNFFDRVRFFCKSSKLYATIEDSNIIFKELPDE